MTKYIIQPKKKKMANDISLGKREKQKQKLTFEYLIIHLHTKNVVTS